MIFETQYPMLQHFALVSLYIGECCLQRSQVPELINLEVLALDRAGETVEFQVILRRSFATAVVREDAVLDGLLVEGQNLVFHLRR